MRAPLGVGMWFLPLYDENPSFRKPVLTYAIMALCVLWYFGYQISQPPEAILNMVLFRRGFLPIMIQALNMASAPCPC